VYKASYKKGQETIQPSTKRLIRFLRSWGGGGLGLDQLSYPSLTLIKARYNVLLVSNIYPIQMLSEVNKILQGSKTVFLDPYEPLALQREKSRAPK
jgi:hypothetical protein